MLQSSSDITQIKLIENVRYFTITNLSIRTFQSISII